MSIELVNSSPFVPLQFESVGARLDLFGVVTAVGTFDIVNGEALRLSADQIAPPLADDYFGEAGTTSLRRPGVLAPYKPRTDVIVEATAHAPSGKAESEWSCEVNVGPVRKAFRVTGPRRWQRGVGGMRLAEIEPVFEVPVRYEAAYGGASTADADVRHASNPVGVGFQPPGGPPDMRCPQVLPVGTAPLVFGRPIETVGIGAIAPSWQPRLGLGGTADDHWRRTRAPYLPIDFSFEFYNSAADGMVFPGFAQGNEVCEFTNLSPEGRVVFALPGIDMATIIQFDDGRWIPGPMNLDTIEIRLEQRTVFLTWRGIFPIHIPTRRIELQMSAPASMIES